MSEEHFLNAGEESSCRERAPTQRVHRPPWQENLQGGLGCLNEAPNLLA